MDESDIFGDDSLEFNQKDLGKSGGNAGRKATIGTNKKYVPCGVTTGKNFFKRASLADRRRAQGRRASGPTRSPRQ